MVFIGMLSLRAVHGHPIHSLTLTITLPGPDRTNIGSAQLAGMGRSLSLVSNQFNIALMLFYVGLTL